MWVDEFHIGKGCLSGIALDILHQRLCQKSTEHGREFPFPNYPHLCHTGPAPGRSDAPEAPLKCRHRELRTQTPFNMPLFSDAELRRWLRMAGRREPPCSTGEV